MRPCFIFYIVWLFLPVIFCELLMSYMHFTPKPGRSRDTDLWFCAAHHNGVSVLPPKNAENTWEGAEGHKTCLVLSWSIDCPRHCNTFRPLFDYLIFLRWALKTIILIHLGEKYSARGAWGVNSCVPSVGLNPLTGHTHFYNPFLRIAADLWSWIQWWVHVASLFSPWNSLLSWDTSSLVFLHIREIG